MTVMRDSGSPTVHMSRLRVSVEKLQDGVYHATARTDRFDEAQSENISVEVAVNDAIEDWALGQAIGRNLASWLEMPEVPKGDKP